MEEWCVSFDQPKCVIRDWLINMYPHLHLTGSGYSARDHHGKWVWRISLWPEDQRVLFNQKQHYVEFVLAWK
jgi:hypothetical protein